MFVDVRDIVGKRRKRMRLTTLNVEEDDWQWLTNHCVKTGMTKSHVVRELIKLYREQSRHE